MNSPYVKFLLSSFLFLVLFLDFKLREMSFLPEIHSSRLHMIRAYCGSSDTRVSQKRDQPHVWAESGIN